MDLKRAQTASILKMLDFNTNNVNDDTDTNMINLVQGNIGGDMMNGENIDEDWSDQWKILIYDKHCRDIISPLLNVPKLRRKGVTLHLLIDSDR